jgi:FtsZ-binding cell division protein ZapB
MSVIEVLQAEFDELQGKVQAVKDLIEPIREKREEINRRQQALQVEIDHQTALMQEVYSEHGYLELAREFGRMASALSELKRGG